MHDHSHDHDHHHNEEESGIALRVKAMEQILTEKGLIDTDAVDGFVDLYETKIGPKNGARVVARAWTDPAFKKRLLENGTDAVAELGFSGLQGENFVVLENSDEVHNIVVCTLCSCYPWPVLGLPPRWYKDAPFRSRVVKRPRTILEEFGTHLPEGKKIKVWDSSAEIRYMVMPQRPAGTDDLNEQQLADLVTRDSMIGVTVL